MLLTAGDRLGPYEVLAPLGTGGMGEVYKARDTRLDRIVAVKVSQEKFSERFEREARSIAKLNHPHICTLHDVGPNYLVMELVEGAPLKGPLPSEEALRLAAQICEALDAAHRKGITHRDLKPSNILVTKQGIKLLDFGLARVVPGPEDQTLKLLTQPGVVMGTPAYMSPEQWEGKPADARSDIFAFGCVLYELLSGKRVTHDRKPLESATLERIVRTCLETDPEDRWQSVHDIKCALALPAASQAAAAKQPSRVLLWIAAAAVLTALSGWAFDHFRQRPAAGKMLRLQIVPPENGRFVFGTNAGGISISPDGKTVAYVISGAGGNGLWVRPLDGTTARFLPGTEGAAYPFWAPDSKTIGFSTSTQLKRIDVAGGTPQPICSESAIRGGAWTEDDHILFGKVSSGLFQVAATGGVPSPLTTLEPGEASHRWPYILPGGRFLYLVLSDKRGNGVYAASLAKSSERVLLADTDTNAVYGESEDHTGYLLWLRGGSLVAQQFDAGTSRLTGSPHPVADPVSKIGSTGQMNVAVSVSGLLLYSASNTSSQLSWRDRSGKPVSMVGEAGEYSVFRLSPDGLLIAATRDRPGGSDLWVLDAERGRGPRLTDSPTNIFPVWSPDGKRILYSSGAARNLVSKASSGEGPELRLTQSPNNQFSTDWSEDGRSILYSEIAPGTQRDLWVLPLALDGKPSADAKPYLRTQFSEAEGRFSPELTPRWVAYQSDLTGRPEIYINSFPVPHGEIPISTGGGLFPQWSPKGDELFYVSLDYKLMAVRLKVVGGSIEASSSQELFPLGATDIGWRPYDTAAYGQRFLVRGTPEGAAAQPLQLIANWPTLLKRSNGRMAP